MELTKKLDTAKENTVVLENINRNYPKWNNKTKQRTELSCGTTSLLNAYANWILRKRRDGMERKIFFKLMAKYFPNLVKTTNA